MVIINENELRGKVGEWTQEYFTKLLEDVSIFDMAILIESSIESFKDIICEYYGKLEKEDEQFRQWVLTLKYGEWENDDFIDRIEEILWCESHHEFFFEYYPIFNKFAEIISDLFKDCPNGDCYSGTDFDNLNREYNQKVLQYACGMNKG